MQAQSAPTSRRSSTRRNLVLAVLCATAAAAAGWMIFLGLAAAAFLGAIGAELGTGFSF
jgi:hypothetical protein